MTNLFRILVLVLASALAVLAADASGKWTFEQAGRNGGPSRVVTITLKQDGNKLTGSVPGFGRGGDAPPPPTEISNGKVEGDKLSFDVKREMAGNALVVKYSGTLSGDEMRLTITTETQNGPASVEVKARRCPPDCR